MYSRLNKNTGFRFSVKNSWDFECPLGSFFLRFDLHCIDVVLFFVEKVPGWIVPVLYEKSHAANCDTFVLSSCLINKLNDSNEQQSVSIVMLITQWL